MYKFSATPTASLTIGHIVFHFRLGIMYAMQDLNTKTIFHLPVRAASDKYAKNEGRIVSATARFSESMRYRRKENPDYKIVELDPGEFDDITEGIFSLLDDVELQPAPEPEPQMQ